jgi:hypothetical protein
LEAQKRNGEILRYEYEGITLRWAGLRYTPDFIIFGGQPQLIPYDIRLIEVKGGYIKGKFERAIERFRHAKTYWPEFTFELWQKADGRWSQIA